MKIVMISQDFFPLKGGIANYLLQFYKKYLIDTEFEVIVPESIGNKEDFKNLPFKVNQLQFSPFDSGNRDKLNQHFIDLLKKIKPDVILFGYLRSHSEIGDIYKKVNPKTKYGIIMYGKETFFDESVTSQTNIEGSQKGYTLKEIIFYKNILNKADFVFSVSEFTKANLERQGIKRKIIVLPPSIDFNLIHKDKYARKKLGLCSDDFVILSVGRLISRKCQGDVILALSKLIKQIPAIRYLIVGDGLTSKDLIKMIKKFRLQKNICIYKSITDKELPKFYSACDLFVLPCKFIPPNDIEGFGIVFLEANAYGKCVIGGDSGGIKEAILSEKTGFLIKPECVSDLKNIILTLYLHPKLRQKIGTSGRARVKKYFNSNKNYFLLELFSN